MSKYYVGLDVSMKETFVCIVDEIGKIVREGQVKTDPVLIAEFLEKAKIKIGTEAAIEKVGLESGCISHWLIEELLKLKIPAICIDARKMAAVLSVRVNKTDKNDARGIADAIRCNLYKEVIAKSPRSIEIGTLMGSRRLLVEEKVKLSNSIRGFLKTYGIRLESTTDINFSKKVKDKIKDLGSIAKEGILSLLNCFEKVLEELKNLTQKIAELAKEDPVVKRLSTIPGVGVITAMAYRTEIDDPTKFKNSRAVGAYLGMTPRQYSSGETQKQGRVSKCGSKETRTLLTEAALVLMSRSRQWSKLKAWGLKIQKKHGLKKAMMAVGRKLAVIMHQMWIKEADFIYGEPKGEKQPKKDKQKNTKSLAQAI